MQSTIKSTLSLLISRAGPLRGQAGVRGDADRSPTLDPRTDICGLRCLLSGFPQARSGTGLSVQSWCGGEIRRRGRPAVHSGRWIYCTQGERDKSGEEGGREVEGARRAEI